MEIIYFLIIIGVSAFAVLWAMRKSKTRTGLAGRSVLTKAKPSNELLATPADTLFSHKKKLWATRRKQTTKGFSNPRRFIPRSEAAKESKYDGFSRRDRHHLATTGEVKEEAHDVELAEPKMTSVEFDSKKHDSQT
jgi:hypothetical protein